MFNQRFIRNAIDRSAENSVDRRKFLRAAGAAGLVGAGAATYAGAGSALAGGGGGGNAGGPSDAAILNFALNLEYLEAEFYLRAIGSSLEQEGLTGGSAGPVTVPENNLNLSGAVKSYAEEIASDERAHVAFLQSALGSAAVPQPALNLDSAFTAAARAAGVVGENETFNPYSSEAFFLLGAYIFEDVGVTAYKGAAPLIDNKTFLEAAAGILAVEAYHAGNIRTALATKGIAAPDAGIFDITNKISDARDSLDDPNTDKDQGLRSPDDINIVVSDENGIAFSRNPGDVLNIVYLTGDTATEGGFFPNGVNGPINQSSGA